MALFALVFQQPAKLISIDIDQPHQVPDDRELNFEATSSLVQAEATSMLLPVPASVTAPDLRRPSVAVVPPTRLMQARVRKDAPNLIGVSVRYALLHTTVDYAGLAVG
jgi:hypothetical protein